MAKSKRTRDTESSKSGSHETRDNPLLEKVRAACQRLAPEGWAELFSAHGLNIEADDLAAQLASLLKIDREIPGFEDFAAHGIHGIEPGQPARSLLYHAFASPRVHRTPSGEVLRAFPTPAEIEAVENYVFGVRPPSLEDLRLRAHGAPLAIVVFAYEYREALSTVHQHHADFCYSRTGVARVGTRGPMFLEQDRGYVPLDNAHPHDVNVLPCRYAAFIAAQLPGDRDHFGPVRFQTAPTIAPIYGAGAPSPQGDASRKFWVPLHKLFNGASCIRGFDLIVQLTAHHFNQKLRKVHRILAGQGFDTGWHEPELSQSPFIFSEFEGHPLANFSSRSHDGTGLLVPTPRPHLVQLARMKDGRVATLRVPPENTPYKSSLNINARDSGVRSAPEYVHVRHKYDPDQPGEIVDLNQQPDVAEIVAKGGYHAVHYLDFTADGWIQVSCPSLRLDLPQNLPAFSVIAPPDYFPFVDQLELMRWWDQSAPPDLAPHIWPDNPGKPLPLCDMRYPGNLSFRTIAGHRVDDQNPDFDNRNNDVTIFDPSDGTMTAIVSSLDAGQGPSTHLPAASRTRRASTLPDGAAGVFAPGWDSSIDRTEEKDVSDNGVTINPGTTFLATYGLGSPFPEDAKLCAALSSFWPAAAPDVTRTFEPSPKYATATPLPDDVLGQAPGSAPWDGIPARVLSVNYPDEIEYFAIDYGDYVQAALDKKMDGRAIAAVDASEYVARTLAMARVYETLGAKETVDKREWAVFSFRPAKAEDPDLIAAQKACGVQLGSQYSYRFEIYHPEGMRPHPKKLQWKLVRFKSIFKFFADPSLVLTNFTEKEKPPGDWRKWEF